MQSGGGGPTATRGRQAFRRLVHGQDHTTDDQIDILRLISDKDKQKAKHAATQILQPSPNNPLGYEYLMRHDWENIQPRFEQRRSVLMQYPIIMSMAIYRDMEAKRWDKAEPLLRRYIERWPDTWSYQALAAIYTNRGDDEKAMETLKKFAALPNTGLAGARAKDRLARFFMHRGDYEAARPYADAAAESMSAWGLLTAAYCYEGFGQWDKAEVFVKHTSLGYTNFRNIWYAWCLKNKSENTELARQDAMENYLDSRGDGINIVVANMMGEFQLLEQAREKSLSHYPGFPSWTLANEHRWPPARIIPSPPPAATASLHFLKIVVLVHAHVWGFGQSGGPFHHAWAHR
jgi:tetratricopeptide (TPR) repeat protein